MKPCCKERYPCLGGGGGSAEHILRLRTYTVQKDKVADTVICNLFSRFGFK